MTSITTLPAINNTKRMLLVFWKRGKEPKIKAQPSDATVPAVRYVLVQSLKTPNPQNRDKAPHEGPRRAAAKLGASKRRQHQGRNHGQR